MRRDDILLLDMLLASREAAHFAHGLTFETFSRDRKSQLAILKAVETIGEAASRVSTDTRNAHPEIPWAEIVGMRHRLVHEYFNVNLARVWETAERDVPSLIPLLERLVPPETGE
ncbi:MAG: DUF86 domain-containing protein [Rhodospirillaceae bacterium]|nr:DUF86 domain-containing protein [Rhodospirillaceae bacterium]